MVKYLTILACSVIGVLVILAVERSFVTQISIKVDDLKKEYDIIYNENKTLRTEITSIIAVEKLYKIAENKKYVSPTKEDIVYLNND